MLNIPSARRRAVFCALAGAAALVAASSAHARGGDLSAFNAKYPKSQSSANAGCQLCHGSSTSTFNEYGWGLRQNGSNFDALEGLSSVNINGGTTNLDEINAGTQPGWTTGANNNLYDENGLIPGTQTPPDGIVGDLDPAAANNPPIVESIPNQTNDEDQRVTLQVVASDSDTGDTLAYSAMGLPAGLSIDDASGMITGTISFDAVIHPNRTQAFNVTVMVSDGTDTTPQGFTWTVNDVNRLPVAAGDTLATLQDQPGSVDVQANDSDADGDTLITVGVMMPTHGTVVINAGDTVTYTPDAGFVGSDAFTYTIIDGFGGEATATVTVTVANVNDPPALDPVPNQASDEGQEVSLQVVAEDPDGPTPLSYSATGLPPALTIDDATGLISGTVSSDAIVHPAIQDVYPVTVDVSDGLATASVAFDWTITDVNRAPVADDDSATTPHDMPVAVDVVANDSDPDRDALTVAGVGRPTNGMATDNLDNTVTYTPDAGFVGTDSFTYTIDDGFGASVTATVTVDVTNQAPVAVDDVFATDQDTVLNVAAPGVLDNDSDADGDPLTAVPGGTSTANGTVTLNADGSFSYMPDAGFSGRDTFTYFANDGLVDSNQATVTINVAVVNVLPVVTNPGLQTGDEGSAVSLQIVASDPNGDTLGYSAMGLPPALGIDANSGLISGTIAFDAVVHPELSAVYPVTVAVSDGMATTTQDFDWMVNDVNQAPNAVDDAVSTQVDTPVTVDVLVNDSDPDGDALTVTGVGMPTNGTVTDDAITITYTPNTGFTGMDTYTYTVDDGFGVSAMATVTIMVTAAPPVDLDIAQFKVTKRVRLAKVRPISIQLTVKNNGDVEGDATATIVGVQNGVEVYNEPMTVSDPVGNGRTKFDFPDFMPTEAGEIGWTATIGDDEPDVDEATTTTTVQ